MRGCFWALRGDYSDNVNNRVLISLSKTIPFFIFHTQLDFALSYMLPPQNTSKHLSLNDLPTQPPLPPSNARPLAPPTPSIVVLRV